MSSMDLLVLLTASYLGVPQSKDQFLFYERFAHIWNSFVKFFVYLVFSFFFVYMDRQGPETKCFWSMQAHLKLPETWTKVALINVLCVSDWSFIHIASSISISHKRILRCYQMLASIYGISWTTTKYSAVLLMQAQESERLSKKADGLMRAFDSLSEGIMVCDSTTSNLQILFLNDIWCKMTGTNFCLLVPPANMHMGLLNK